MRRRRKPASIGARLRYGFDTRLSRGASSVIIWLGVVTCIIVIIAALILTLFRIVGVNGGGRLDFVQAFYQSILRVLDTGTVANDKDWPARLVGLIVTLAGIFIAGSLIGLIANAVDQRLEQLRRGRSEVLEIDHVLILGWAERVPAIVAELLIANESRADAAIVVLADHDKTEMQEALAGADRASSTRIICRSGEPWLPASLELVNAAGARAVVIVGDGREATAVMCLLGVHAVTAGRGIPIVAEIDNAQLADSVSSIFNQSITLVSSDAVVAELTAQACRRPGLTAVFRELLDFEGDEIYMAGFPPLVGKTYAEVQLAFETSAVIGVRRADGTIELNPPAATVYESKDQVVAIAADDSEFLLADEPAAGVICPTTDVDDRDHPMTIMIVGWSSIGPRVVSALDEFLDQHSRLEVVVSPHLIDTTEVHASCDRRRVSIQVVELAGGPEAVGAHCIAAQVDEVILLGYRDALDIRDADARTLLTMLACAGAKDARGGRTRLVAELLDQRNVPLAQASGGDDFIVSEELVSRMLAQLVENPNLEPVFTDLFDREGCAVELEPARRYGAQHASTFADVIASASTVGDSAFGYRVAATGEVVLNPAKSARLTLGPDDEIVVLAERV